MEKNQDKAMLKILLVLTSVLFIFIFLNSVNAADPEGPSSITWLDNETKASVDDFTWNVSGGYISHINFSATTQNSRWKGMVGWVNGLFTLDDASGNTLFEWSLTTITGQVYATTNATSPTWSSLSCANITRLELENNLMEHSSSEDNITKTFSNQDHDPFTAAGVSISENDCYSLRTYVENNTQSVTEYFEEVALFDGHNSTGGGVVYATILEDDQTGYDSEAYDFQMIVPENGNSASSIVTAYYIYIELT